MIQTMSDELKFKIAQSVLNSNARIGVFVMELNGDFHNHGDKDHADDEVVPTDDQIARALMACVGKDRVINAKWKWVGAYWYLRWACNYPVNVQLACARINGLPFTDNLAYACDYRNIRELCNLSFMDQDPRKIDKVVYSRNDEAVFLQCREIVLKLAEELGKSHHPTT